MRPTASISAAQTFFDMETGERSLQSVQGRHDACFALRIPVILEAAAAVVIADLMLLEGRIPRVLS